MKRKRRKNTLSVLLITAGILLAGLILIIALNGWYLQIDGIGAPDEYVECKTAYPVPTGYASVRGTHFATTGIPLQCQQSGTVNTDQTGDYVLRYTCKLLWMEKTVEKRVHVQDTTPPILYLVPEKRAYIPPDQSYEDPGYAALDSVDGDLTSRVEVRKEGDRILYSVTDSAGNLATAERILTYSDTEPPELVLLGASEMELDFGQNYEEPGYTAVDNRDGDLTDRVTVEGEVGDEAGEYVLTYTVSDSFQNQATAVRKVTVKPLRQPDTVVPDGKVIYLTFDDGPSQYTARLLEILDQYNVKASFFVVNYGYSDLIAKEAAAGHSVGVHSLTHDYNKIYVSEEAYFADLNAMNEIIKAQTGSYSKLIRFPGGSSNTVSSFNAGIMTRLTQRVLEAGYQYFDWNVSSGDAGLTTDTDEVYQNVIDGIQGHDVSIVLQHDSKGYSVDAVERIIIWGLENGYTFLPLDYNSPAAHHRINN